MIKGQKAKKVSEYQGVKESARKGYDTVMPGYLKPAAAASTPLLRPFPADHVGDCPMVRQAHHDTCHPELVEGQTVPGETNDPFTPSPMHLSSPSPIHPINEKINRTVPFISFRPLTSSPIHLITVFLLFFCLPLKRGLSPFSWLLLVTTGFCILPSYAADDGYFTATGSI